MSYEDLNLRRDEESGYDRIYCRNADSLCAKSVSANEYFMCLFNVPPQNENRGTEQAPHGITNIIAVLLPRILVFIMRVLA